MKFFKFIFILIVICLVCYSAYLLYDKKEIVEENIVEVLEEETILTDLRLSIVNLDNMNPILSTNKNVQDISKLIFDSLLTVDENYKIKNSLAEEFSKSGNNTYLLKLRNDVLWHDGSKFNAYDVKYTIDMIKDNNVSSIYKYNLQHIVGLNIIDEYTIKLTVDEEEPFFEYNLTFPILSYNNYLNEDFLNTDKNSKPIGTGMYKITDVQGTSITLRKNDEWWNINESNAKISIITIKLYETMGDAYNDFKLGKIDLIATNNYNLEDYIGSIGYSAIDYKGREYDYIAMNCNSNILQNLEVRQAISYAIDKTAIIEEIFESQYYVSMFPLDYGNYAYKAENGSLGYNPEQSKKILEDNGWEYKNDNWRKTENNKTVKIYLNFVVNAENEKRTLVAEKIAQQLGEVGITVNLIKATNDQYQKYLANKNYDLILTGTINGFTPNLSRYFANGNLANYTNQKAIEALNEANKINSEATLQKKISELVEFYNNDVPYVSLYYNKARVIVSDKLVGEVVANNYNIFYRIGVWHRKA